METEDAFQPLDVGRPESKPAPKVWTTFQESRRIQALLEDFEEEEPNGPSR